MRVAVPRERKVDEGRVALTPDIVAELVRRGHEVLVEHGAGALARHHDDAYRAAGGVMVDRDQIWARGDLIVKVKEPVGDELALIRADSTLFCYLHLAAEPDLTQALRGSGCTAVAFETVEDPLGRLPLLEPMSEVAGRLGGMWGAFLLQRTQGGVGVLPGGLPGVRRAKALVLGGGTAGRHAADVLLGMGADVAIGELSIARLRELSTWLDRPFDGFLSTPDEVRRRAMEADVVVTAALIPGHPSPRLLDRSAVAAMRNGAVICDISIDQGGCVETSRPTTHSDPTYVVDGVVHTCITNLPAAVSAGATQALSNAIRPHVLAIADRGWDAAATADLGLARGLNVLDGEIRHEGISHAQVPIPT